MRVNEKSNLNVVFVVAVAPVVQGTVGVPEILWLDQAKRVGRKIRITAISCKISTEDVERKNEEFYKYIMFER